MKHLSPLDILAFLHITVANGFIAAECKIYIFFRIPFNLSLHKNVLLKIISSPLARARADVPEVKFFSLRRRRKRFARWSGLVASEVMCKNNRGSFLPLAHDFYASGVVEELRRSTVERRQWRSLPAVISRISYSRLIPMELTHAAMHAF